jgi:predicted enzyme related to lactoylglutathione lyase
MMRTKRPVLVFLGVSLAAFSAACGGSEGKGQATTPVTSSTEPTEPTEPAGPDKLEQPVQPAEPVKPPEPPAPTYLHGKLVWYELVSSDTARSKAFHADLLGWTIEPQEMAGLKFELAKAGSKEVATIRQADDKKAKSHWVPFVSVPDVDAAVAAALQNKGKVVKAAADVPDIGRYAIVSDPNGAQFALFKGVKSDDPDSDQAKQGEFVWAENLTRSKKAQAAALAFYPAAAGYTVSSMDVTEGKKKSKYDMLSVTGPDGAAKHRAGVVPAKPASLGGNWLPWVAVDDVDGTVAKVKGLKGKVVTKPHDIPGVGRAAVVSDPTGAPLGLLKALSPEEQKAAMEKAAADKAAPDKAAPKKKDEKKAPEAAPTP